MTITSGLWYLCRAMSEEEIKRYLASIGSKGGKAGTGKSKMRGGTDYYRRISRMAVKAREARRKKLNKSTNTKEAAQ